MAENETVPNSKEKISRLDSWSVHRICSGQVIVSLAVAVKELVENALDACATDIVIRTKEFGSQLIEVQDDGDGIQEENFAALCQKHYTSKLHEFAELENIITFGFRGEALSSLCALGELTVTTKHHTKQVGSFLKYDSEGQLVGTESCARAKGTTVTVKNIFSSLPVRHRQFTGNLKKEFAKMVHFMSGYCLIARDVAISLVNIDGRGKRNEVLKNRANSTYKDNIVEIFGYKEATRLLPYEQAEISEEVKQEFALNETTCEQFKETVIVGFVSNCEHGKGRSSADRQFVFVNSRPCDFPKLTRTINSVYHQFNSSQYPFVMLNIVTPQHLVDVNLTPDKRMLLLQRENVILAVVKASLTSMFQKQATKYTMSSVSKSSFLSNASSQSLELDGDSSEETEEESRSRCANRPRELLERRSGPDSQSKELDKNTLKERFSFGSETERSSKRSRQEFPAEDLKSSKGSEIPTLSQFGFIRHRGKKPRLDDEDDSSNKKCNSERLLKQKGKSCGELKSEKTFKEGETDFENRGSLHLLTRQFVNDDISDRGASCLGNPASEDVDDETSSIQEMNVSDVDDSSNSENSPPKNLIISTKKQKSRADEELSLVLKESDSEGDENCGQEEDEENEEVVDEEGENEEVIEEEEENEEVLEEVEKNEEVAEEKEEMLFVDEVAQRKVGVISLNWTEDDMKEDFVKLEKERNSNNTDKEETKKSLNNRQTYRFRARISPKENNNAESELSCEIKKEMFNEMEIIGQFNKGFIIVKLNDDLFIVDQHAADEKYNFETLQATTVINCQPLTIPLKLFLAPGSEQVVLEHLAIFEKNGFRLSCDENAPYGRKLSLTAVPESGQWAMGASEIDELVFMLNENYHPNLMNCRPSKVRAMFAMRACRKSVMVGHELKVQDMKRVVSQLSGLQQPWNCPHGRPTMRHLVNLNLVEL